MTVTSWWICKDCKKEVSLVSETLTLHSKQCPFCHNAELIRDTQKEWNNRYRLILEV